MGSIYNLVIGVIFTWDGINTLILCVIGENLNKLYVSVKENCIGPEVA
jgi:hypothetical protein